MILLASQSPRRRELLNQIGIAHEVIPADVDETPLGNESPLAYVRRITLAKATAGAAQRPSQPVLAADTCVVVNDTILGKPDDSEHAIRMLRQLSGTTHEVHTGVALFHDGQQQLGTFLLCQRSTGPALLGDGRARRQGRRLCHTGIRRIVHRTHFRQLLGHHGAAPV